MGLEDDEVSPQTPETAGTAIATDRRPVGAGLRLALPRGIVIYEGQRIRAENVYEYLWRLRFVYHLLRSVEETSDELENCVAAVKDEGYLARCRPNRDTSSGDPGCAKSPMPRL